MDEKKNEDVEPLSQEPVDLEDLSPEDLEEVAGGLDSCGINCGTYSQQ